MRRRLLPVLLILALACAGGAAILLPGDRERPARGASAPAPLAALTALGAGPEGSARVALELWRFRPDPRDVGREEGWARGDWPGAAVRVPHVANPDPVAGPGAREAYAGSVGWYAREIRVPVAGRYAVRFESAHHRAAVYVDGRRVRTHTGAYQPFSARVALPAGSHTVAVRVDWRDPREQARSGWARAWFNFGGLHRPVTLSRVGATELRSPGVRTELLDDGRARVTVDVRLHGMAPRGGARVRGTLRHAGESLPLRFRAAGEEAARRATGEEAARRATVVVADPELWSPARPALHDLRVEVPGAAVLERRVGLREVRWDDGALRLNGEPLELRGVALPPDVAGRGDAFTAADEAEVVRGLRAAGANATRSQLPLSESMLERLDAAGILVWQHVGPFEPAGAWRLDAPRQIDEAVRRAAGTVARQRAHPSIVAWTLTNEAAGQGQPEQTAYVRRGARAVRALDPGRPVAADLWGKALPREAGPLHAELDAIGVTDYAGWYEELELSAAERARSVAERLARMRRLFAGKPLVVTEFGAAGSERIPDDEFGGVGFHAGLLAERIAALDEVPGLSGMLVWNLRDFALRPGFRGGSVLDLRPDLDLAPGINEKGLFDYRGDAKPALRAVREAFARSRG